MSNSDHDWSLYRSFLAVFRNGSLSAAARALGATQPTIGRHIEALEKSLDGKVLFTRSQNGLLPTDVARELLPHAEAMAAAADALVRAASASAHEIAGTVRIAASEIVGVEVLPPMLTEFRRKHPKIELELCLSNKTVDLLRRDADLAVRMVQPEQKALIARKIGVVTLLFYGTREYLERYGTPKSLDDLEKHSLIGFDRHWPPAALLDRLPIKIRKELFSFRSDNDAAQIAALRAGFGLGVVQVGIAKKDSNLVPVLADKLRLQLEVWVVMHENLKKDERTRIVFDHLAESLDQYVREAEKS